MASAEIAAVRAAFLDAPFSEGGWMTALRLFAQATGSSHANLIGVGERAVQFNFTTDVGDGYDAEFAAIEGWRPDVNWRIAANGGTMEVIHERHYDAVRPLMANDFYTEHSRRWGGIHGAQTALMQEPGELIGLAIMRGEAEGRTRARDRAVFADGAEHALAAVKMQRAMAHRGAQLLAGTLESLGLAAFLLDRAASVTALTPQAETIAAQPDGPVQSLRDKRLHARRSGSALEHAIAQALAGAAQVQSLWLEAGGTAQHGMRSDVIALPRRDYAFGFDPRVMVVLHDAADLPARAAAPLRQALGLTASEADIALRLADGADRDRIAQERGTSTQTLATQIKALLRKGDVTRESELVALINRLMR